MKDNVSYSFENASFLFGTNTTFIEKLYTDFLKEPTSVDPDWRSFFEQISKGEDKRRALDRETRDITARKPQKGQTKTFITPENREQHSEEEIPAATLDSIRALMLIRAYRVRGHLMANLDPLGLDSDKKHPELDPSTYGFSDCDYDRPIFVDGVLGLQWATLREVLSAVRQTYCGQIGVEFMHIQDPAAKSWIQQAFENSRNDPGLENDEKLTILTNLNQAEGFERFLDIKYKGAKRFSLEGSESIIPALEAIIESAALYNVEEIVIGMMHRGRLNVLTKILGKSYAEVFSEFQGLKNDPTEIQGSGDVKYHLGASADKNTSNGNKIHVSLTPNPSHLEAVNPVVLGKVRAKQTMRKKSNRSEILGILLHGDAAFAGQGLVSETFELSALRGYRTSGTIHVVVNNQIGFTTSPSLARSTPYCSDIAKSVQAPIFHVNGDDPEAVVKVCRLAIDYRQQFSRDIVIDIFCYRRHGHNETDEPAFTQPIMYRAINQKHTTREQYESKLIEEGVISKKEADLIVSNFRNTLEKELEASKSAIVNKPDWLQGSWSKMTAPPKGYKPGNTSVSLKDLKKVGESLINIPTDFNLHPRLNRLIKAKEKSLTTGTNIDWATSEALAFGSLLLEGHTVRLSGQDISRGTFSQRHAAFWDQKTEERFIPLNNIEKGQAEIELVDSMLSEAGVLGYEYGYSITDPGALVIWEAQFGDFANGAQAIIDQFVASGEMKWLRMSGLVMLLPHGYEGQGPEHSSARLERYLQLFAQDNIQIVNCTTPANYFHVLRRQLHRNFRKPLIVMSPKSLLRHKKCVSNISEFNKGTRFHRVLRETEKSLNNEKVRRVIICSGKVYYDLYEERKVSKINDIAILRLEEIAPFPDKSLKAELGKYPKADVIWCQEEPFNMGAWSFVSPRIDDILHQLFDDSRRVSYIGREASASTATGYTKVHEQEQKSLINKALN